MSRKPRPTSMVCLAVSGFATSASTMLRDLLALPIFRHLDNVDLSVVLSRDLHGVSVVFPDSRLVVLYMPEKWKPSSVWIRIILLHELTHFLVEDERNHHGPRFRAAFAAAAHQAWGWRGATRGYRKMHDAMFPFAFLLGWLPWLRRVACTWSRHVATPWTRVIAGEPTQPAKTHTTG